MMVMMVIMVMITINCFIMIWISVIIIIVADTNLAPSYPLKPPVIKAVSCASLTTKTKTIINNTTRNRYIADTSSAKSSALKVEM